MGQVRKAAGQQLGHKPSGDLWETCRAAPKLPQQQLQIPRQTGCPGTAWRENRADFRHGAPRASGLKLMAGPERQGLSGSRRHRRPAPHQSTSALLSVGALRGRLGQEGLLQQKQQDRGPKNHPTACQAQLYGVIPVMPSPF